MIKYYIDEQGKIFKVSKIEDNTYKVENNKGDIGFIEDLKKMHLVGTYREIHNDKAETLMKKQYELQTKLEDILNELDLYTDLVLQDENIEYAGE